MNEIKKVSLSDIKPYWRNPRDNREAVSKVKKSIIEYGYNQLIGVDKDLTIIVGHTRWQALREIVPTPEKIDVIILDLTPEKAKQYRIIDNKTAEFAIWNDDLTIELKEIEDLSLMAEFFKKDIRVMIGDSIGVGSIGEITQEQIDKTSAYNTGHFADVAREKALSEGVICPKCGEEFSIR